MGAITGAFIESIPEEDVEDIPLVTAGGDAVYPLQRTAIRFSSIRGLLEVGSAGKAPASAPAAGEARDERAWAAPRLPASYSRRSSPPWLTSISRVLVQPIQVAVFNGQRSSAETPLGLAYPKMPWTGRLRKLRPSRPASR